jgi:hypothetical protein
MANIGCLYAFTDIAPIDHVDLAVPPAFSNFTRTTEV